MSALIKSYRNVLTITILPFLLLLSSALESAPDSVQASPFVQANGRDLTLNGKPYKFIGVTLYDLLTIPKPYRGCGHAWRDNDLSDLFATFKSMGINTVRFSAFQRFLRTDSGLDFQRFDYLLSLAQANGIKMIPVLENQWAACTVGGYKFNTWYTEGYRQIARPNHLSYQDYVTQVVLRYKDSPEILMWQLVGEAESKSAAGGSDAQALFDFTQHMSAYVKSLDANHLLSLGAMGGGQPGTKGDSYRKLHAIWSIDLVGFTDYQHLVTTPNGLRERAADSVALNKPLFVQEAGIRASCQEPDCMSPAQRAEIFGQKLAAFLPDGVGYVIWRWAYRHETSVLQPYAFDQDDPLAAVVSDVAHSLLSSP